MNRILSVVTLLCSSLLLSHCGTSNVNTYHTNRQNTQQDPYHYLALAEQNSGQQAVGYRLTAISQLISEGKYSQANQQLSRLPVPTNELSSEYHLVNAELLLKSQESDEALTHLMQASKLLHKFDSQTKLRYYQLSTQAFQNTGNSIEVIKARIALDPLLTQYKQSDNRQRIWQELHHLSGTALQHFPKGNEKTLDGWLELAMIAQHQTINAYELIDSLKLWQQRYPEHPGQSVLPTHLNQALYLEQMLPQQSTGQIALLIPQSGPHQAMAQIIQDGIFYGFYHQQKSIINNIKVYDTHHQDITKLYQRAVNDGAEFVIGPLTKQDVNELLSDYPAKKVPTLLLNAPSNTQHFPQGFFSLDLNPEQETDFLATHLYEKGFQHAVILTEESEYGERAAKSFNTAFHRLGGKMVTTLSLQPGGDHATTIRSLLSLDTSQSRYQKVKSLLGRRTEFQPRRRADIDVIVLSASAPLSRQVRPMFDFYYAQSLPIYGLSALHEGDQDPKRDRDLNGIIFSDIPMLLKSDKHWVSLRNSLYQEMPDYYKTTPRLYALGWDAFMLSQQMSRLLLFPKLGIPGALGQLTLDESSHIKRQFDLAKISNGRAQLIQK